MSDTYFCPRCNEWHVGLGIEDPHYSEGIYTAPVDGLYSIASPNIYPPLRGADGPYQKIEGVREAHATLPIVWDDKLMRWYMSAGTPVGAAPVARRSWWRRLLRRRRS